MNSHASTRRHSSSGNILLRASDDALELVSCLSHHHNTTYPTTGEFDDNELSDSENNEEMDTETPKVVKVAKAKAPVAKKSKAKASV
jgi:hypothetical protein